MYICYDLTIVSWLYVWLSTYFFMYYSCTLFLLYCFFTVHLCAIDTRFNKCNLLTYSLLTTTFTQMILNFFLVPSSQLWLKYRPPPDCSEQISSWMSANLLTLNSSKTEFLIIGLKQQLSKIDNITLHSIPLILHAALVLLSRRPGSRQAVRGLDFQEICSSTCMRAWPSRQANVSAAGW